jgi:predicted nucleic acid-binding protein
VVGFLVVQRREVRSLTDLILTDRFTWCNVTLHRSGYSVFFGANGKVRWCDCDIVRLELLSVTIEIHIPEPEALICEHQQPGGTEKIQLSREPEMSSSRIAVIPAPGAQSRTAANPFVDADAWCRSLRTWLHDTNVLSEIRRTRREPKALSFLAETPLSELYISTVTLAQLRFGIALLNPDCAQRIDLSPWLNQTIRSMFEDRVMPGTEEIPLRLRMADGRKGLGGTVSRGSWNGWKRSRKLKKSLRTIAATTEASAPVPKSILSCLPFNRR